MYPKQNRYNQEDTETIGEKIATSILFVVCVVVLVFI